MKTFLILAILILAGVLYIQISVFADMLGVAVDMLKRMVVICVLIAGVVICFWLCRAGKRKKKPTSNN